MAFYNVFTILYIISALAAVIVVFWLAITAIRALNIYIVKTRLQIASQRPVELDE
ncbi:hypothetical protein GCM10027416_04930 [Okibacterium endophyticum]